MRCRRPPLVTSVLCLLVATTATAGEPLRHSGASVRHSAAAVGESVRATTGLVSAAVAVPLSVAGAVGRASGEAGEALWQAGTGAPLPIGDETVTAGPSPAEALADQAGTVR